MIPEDSRSFNTNYIFDFYNSLDLSSTPSNSIYRLVSILFSNDYSFINFFLIIDLNIGEMMIMFDTRFDRVYY